MTDTKKTVADDMDSRRLFDSVEDAIKYLTASAETFADFADIPLAGAGIDAEGNFNPEVYTSGMRVMVSTLRKNKGGIKAIVVAPVPSLESLLADDAGKAWIAKIIEKEQNHVAVRALRDAEDVSTVVDQMPTTLAAYISSGRGDGGGILETFNELYKGLNATLGSKVPVWAKARLVKSELKRSLESKGYANEFYPALENRGEGKDSLFVVALNLGIAAAKEKGLDPTIFERWKETRDAKAFKPGDETDEDDLDIESLTSSLLTEDKKEEEAPATA